MKITIRTRYYGGTNIARTVGGPRAQASSTNRPQLAAEACAKKVFKKTPFTIKSAGDGTFIADDGKSDALETSTALQIFVRPEELQHIENMATAKFYSEADLKLVGKILDRVRFAAATAQLSPRSTLNPQRSKRS